MTTPVRNHGFIKRMMAMLLVVMMVLTTSVSAFAVDGGGLSGDIATDTENALVSEGVSDNDSIDSGSLEPVLDQFQNGQGEEDAASNEVTGTSIVDPAEVSPDWLRDYLEAVFSWEQAAAAPFRMMRAASASGGSTATFTRIKWPTGSESQRLIFGQTSYIGGGNGIPRISLNGDVAFCGQYNENDPGGSYTPMGEGSDNRIKQILANYDNSDKSNGAYAAAQVAIWAHLLHTTVAQWGECPGAAYEDEIFNGTCDYSDLKYNYIQWGGGAQNLITYHTDDVPPEIPGDDDGDDTPPTGGDDDDAYGQVTITKKDDEGRALDGAIFRIDITFSDGSTGGQSSFEVKDGQRTYYYKHPKGDTGPATVTVTEVQAPPNYVMDPTPQTVTVNPTYAKSTGGGGGEGGDDEGGGRARAAARASVTITGDDDDDGGEGGGGSGGGAALVIGDRPELTFVNEDEECSLTIYKYQKGRPDIPLAGAQFHIQYADPTVCSDFWDLATDANGEITISMKKPGTLLVTETQAPENYKIIEVDNNRMIVIQRGDHARMEIPNEKHGSLIIYKKDIDDHRPLAGATFEVKKIGSDGGHTGETAGYRKNVTTNENGYALVEGLEPGSYQVTEISPPSFYSLSDNPIQTVTVLEGSHEPVEIEFYNEAFTGLRIVKVDAKTGQGLAGAVFSIYRGDGIRDGEPTGDLVGNYTTNMNGIVFLDKLERGKYTVVEEQAPDGYVLDETPWRIIEVTDYNIHDVIQVIFRNQPKPNLRIIKKDKETGEVLEGAVFRVARQNSPDYNEYTTDKNGEIFIEKLEPDWYIITEMRAPTNYLLNEDPELDPVELIPGHTTEVVVTNQVKPTLTLLKKDAVTMRGLPNATFKVTARGASEYTTVTTDFDGKAVIKGLDAGWYIVEEIKAPAGYLPITESWNIELKPDEDAVITIPNTKMPSLTIKKVDALTRNPLKNAEFELRQSDGTVVYKGLTDGKGEIYLNRIDPGVYRLKETGAPDGYEKVIVEQDVVIEEGKDVVVTVENSAIEPLYIQKIDAKNGKPLDGAVFSVRKTSGEFVGEYTTGISGFATITGLKSGYYEITEIKAPVGYSLPSNPVKTVEIKKGRPATIVFEDQPLNGLYVSKVDADTGRAIPGVSFRVTTVSGDLVGDYVTDANGIFTIVDLDDGAYVVTETEPAPGYVADDTPHTVILKKGETTRLTIKNTPLTGMIILKKDAKTGKPLAGAVFSVETIDRKEIGRYETNSSGVANVPNLATGYYVVTEVKAPNGYAMSANPSQTIHIENGEPVTLTFENEPLHGLLIVKRDAKTGETLGGVSFEVAKSNGEFVGQYKTDKYGLINIPDLPAGSYVIREIAALDGYILDSESHTVALEDGKATVVTVELTNEPLAGLQIRKINGVTNDPLSGVEFEVKTPEGALVGKYTTGADGNIFIGGLQPGAYVVTEMTTKENFTLDAQPHTVAVKSGEMTTEVFKNYEYPILTVKKVDSESGQPLAGAKFKLMDVNYRELGVITTSELGLVQVTNLDAGIYYVQETQAPSGYVLDSTVRQIALDWGKTTVIEVKNTPRGSLRVQKVDSVTGKPLYNATFNLYDSKNNLLGEYTTDNTGMIVFSKSMAAGKYFLKEVKAPDGYVLDSTPITVNVKGGETTELTIKNTPETGNIRIQKVASDYNDITKDKKGAALSGAVFEVYNEKLEVVDRITTGEDGVAKTKDLPLGKYAIKEITPPKYYTTDGKPFYAEIKVAGDLIKFKVENVPTTISTTVQKRGNVEVLPGDSMSWEFYNIENTSSVSLDEFYWHDLIPTDAVRATSFTTGVWSERVNMTAYYRTNLTSGYRVLKDNLLSTTNHELALTSSALGLKPNEYVTDVKLLFGTVQPGFHETIRPTLTAYVLPNLIPGYSIVNRTDVGGRDSEEWVYSKDTWVTISIGMVRGVLPRTGFSLGA